MWKRKSKYGNQKAKSDGRSFHSKLERSVYELLKLREKAKELEVIQCQYSCTTSRAKIRFIPDFLCKDLNTGEFFLVEAKGFEAERWPIVKKLFNSYGINELVVSKMEIWKGSYSSLRLDETLIPEYPL